MPRLFITVNIMILSCLVAKSSMHDLMGHAMVIMMCMNHPLSLLFREVWPLSVFVCVCEREIAEYVNC